jgi:hypothetical protein
MNVLPNFLGNIMPKVLGRQIFHEIYCSVLKSNKLKRRFALVGLAKPAVAACFKDKFQGQKWLDQTLLHPFFYHAGRVLYP